MSLAPIALFVFRRPDHTRRTIESLLANPEAARTEVVVFADGPRADRDVEAVEQTRDVVRRAGIPNLRLVVREKNMGLARSVIAGVTDLCDSHGRVIVLEDDLELSPAFLRFMNEALERYRDDDRVHALSGYMFPIEPSPGKDALFLPFPSSWGWATWSRAWRRLAPADVLYETIRKDRGLRRRFDVDGSYPFTAMLEALLAGRVDSWAIRWRATVFLNGGLTLYPARSLVTNIGFDGTGVHCEADAPVLGAARASAKPVSSYPADIETDEEAYRQVRRMFLGDTGRWRKLVRSGRGALQRVRAALFGSARRER
jgi:GT2 family glycosyltransferase